jgi:hypothetical protein
MKIFERIAMARRREIVADSRRLEDRAATTPGTSD